MMFWLEDEPEVLPLTSSCRLARDDERRLSFRRSSGSFFIFRESFLTVPGDLSLSITLLDTPPFFWEAGLESEAGFSVGGKVHEQCCQPVEELNLIRGFYILLFSDKVKIVCGK